MKYKNTMLVVSDIDCSKSFYKAILGLHVILDFGSNVTLTSGICLRTRETWKDLIHKNDDEIIMQNNASELYFEVEDIDKFMITLNDYNVSLLHTIKEHKWGQRVVRFYDPDGHIIEVGETLRKVAIRFLSQGLSHEEISKIMGIPVTHLKRLIQR